MSVKEILNGASSYKKQERRSNFFAVASKSSSDHVAYRRDLELLLVLAMKIEEKNLALDLGTC